MITVNNRNLCENCFAETDQEPCPFCGFDKEERKKDITVLEIGKVLEDRYLIGGVIGKGGFGITYLAYDIKLEKRIAIKEYFPRGIATRGEDRTTVSSTDDSAGKTFSDGAERFYKEAELVSHFNGNPNIVNVYDFFRENDTVYFTMGYLNGETLKTHMKIEGNITEGQAMNVYRCISNALLITHSMNILHRDISPDNIMLCDDGTIKLIDFGAARQVIAEESHSLSVILKQGFAPLEQYQKKGKQGPWTDIYALGATIYSALTGDYLDDPMSRMDDDCEFQENRFGISEGLWSVIKKSTMLNISDRYQDITELKKDLTALKIKEEDFEDTIADEILTDESSAVSEDSNKTVLLKEDDPVSNNETVFVREASPQEAGESQEVDDAVSDEERQELSEPENKTEEPPEADDAVSDEEKQEHSEPENEKEEPPEADDAVSDEEKQEHSEPEKEAEEPPEVDDAVSDEERQELKGTEIGPEKAGTEKEKVPGSGRSSERREKRSEQRRKRRLILAAMLVVVLVAVPIAVTLIAGGKKDKTDDVTEIAANTENMSEDAESTSEAAADETEDAESTSEAAADEKADSESAGTDTKGTDEETQEVSEAGSEEEPASESEGADSSGSDVTDKKVKVLSNHINIYNEPDATSNYETLFYVKGYVFEVQDESNGWYKVINVNGKNASGTGWINSDDVTLAE